MEVQCVCHGAIQRRLVKWIGARTESIYSLLPNLFFDVLLLCILPLACHWLQVGFHDQKLVCKVHVPKKKTDIVNR